MTLSKATSGVLVVLVLAVSALAADDWKVDMEKHISADIQFTKLGLSGNISSQGSVYFLKLENIQAMPTQGYTANINIIENNNRKEAGTAQRAIGGLLNMGSRNISGIQIEPDSKIGITKLKVGKKEVSVQIVTLRQQKTTIKGSDRSEYLYTWLQFPFENLEALDSAVIRDTIYKAIAPDNPAQIAPTSTRSSAAASSANQNSFQGSTSLVGKTTVELIELLGKNYQTVTLGSRTIYIFPDLGVRGGASAQTDSRYQLLDMPVAKEKARIFFPRTCINKASQPYNQAAEVTFLGDEIVVTVREEFADQDYASVDYVIGPDMNLRRLYVPDFYYGSKP